MESSRLQKSHFSPHSDTLILASLMFLPERSYTGPAAEFLIPLISLSHLLKGAFSHHSLTHSLVQWTYGTPFHSLGYNPSPPLLTYMSTLPHVWLVQPLWMALSHDVPSLSEHSLAFWPLLYFPCSDSGRRPKALILFHGEQSRPHDLHVSCALWCCGLIAPRPVSGQSKNTHTFTQIFMSASIDIKNHEIMPISPVPTQQESAHSKIISLYYLVETALKLSGPRFSLWEDL